MSWYIEEQEVVYLDHNATAPMAVEVEKAIADSLKHWANPSSHYSLGCKAREIIEGARKEVAQLLHVTPNDVFFTSGGTESNVWVIHSAVEHYKIFHGREVSKPHVVTSAIEHPSITETLKNMSQKGEIDLSVISVDPTTGQVRVDEITAALCERTCLVTIMMANNETGVQQPIAEIASVSRKASERFDTRIFVHTDAAQTIGRVDVDPNVLMVDYITVVGRKFHGPGIGALVVRSAKTVPIHALMCGGGQERGKRAGTENTPMIAGLGMAAHIVNQGLSQFNLNMATVRNYFETKLHELLKDAIKIHFEDSVRLPNTSSVAFTAYPDNADVLLSKCKSFVASTGSACHSASKSTSAVLRSCGISDDLASKTVRFSFGRDTTKEHVDRVIKELQSVIFLSKYGSSLLKAFDKGPVPGF